MSLEIEILTDGGKAATMSLRDAAAIQIAPALLSGATGLGVMGKEQRAATFAMAAAISYELADALVAARSA